MKKIINKIKAFFCWNKTSFSYLDLGPPKIEPIAIIDYRTDESLYSDIYRKPFAAWVEGEGVYQTLFYDVSATVAQWIIVGQHDCKSSAIDCGISLNTFIALNKATKYIIETDFDRRFISVVGMTIPDHTFVSQQRFLHLAERYELPVPKQLAFRDFEQARKHIEENQDETLILNYGDGFFLRINAKNLGVENES